MIFVGRNVESHNNLSKDHSGDASLGIKLRCPEGPLSALSARQIAVPLKLQLITHGNLFF